MRFYSRIFSLGILQSTKAWAEMPIEKNVSSWSEFACVWSSPNPVDCSPTLSCILSQGCLAKGALDLLKASTVNSFGWRFCQAVSFCFLLRRTASMCYV